MVCKDLRRFLPLWQGVLALGLASAMVATTQAQPQPADKVVADVFRDLKTRQGAMKSVRYALKGGIEYSQDPKAVRSTFIPIQLQLLLDLENHRYRYEKSTGNLQGIAANLDVSRRWTEVDWNKITRLIVNASDGSKNHLYRDLEKAPADELGDIFISDEIRSTNVFSFEKELNPVFFAHGLIPNDNAEDSPDFWTRGLKPEDVINQGEKMSEGRNYLVFRTKPIPFKPPFGGRKPGPQQGPIPGKGGILHEDRHNEIWISKEEKNVIHRYRQYNGETLSSDLEIHWKNTPNGPWLDHWSLIRPNNDKSRSIIHLQIESMDVNPAITDADFSIKPEPGMKVVMRKNTSVHPDHALSKDLYLHSYLVSSTGDLIEMTRPEILAKTAMKFWYTTAGTMAALGLLIFVGYRYRRLKKGVIA